MTDDQVHKLGRLGTKRLQTQPEGTHVDPLLPRLEQKASAVSYDTTGLMFSG